MVELCNAVPSPVQLLGEPFVLSQVGRFVKIDFYVFSLMRMSMYNILFLGVKEKLQGQQYAIKHFQCRYNYIFSG